MSAKQAETAYQRILRAAAEGRGVRLTAKECWALSHDDAIETVAYADFEAQGVEPPARTYRQGGKRARAALHSTAAQENDDAARTS